MIPSPEIKPTKIDLGNSQCTKCDLCKNRLVVVNGQGNLDSKILIVTDGVGGYEESSGRPVQGLNGKLLDRLLTQAGLSRSSVFITPAIRCKGAPKKPKDLHVVVAACLPYLQKEIEAIKPNVIVPMGSTALRAVMESKTLNITKERGIVRFSTKYNCKIVPIFHPAYLMQVPQFEKVTIQDLCRAKYESRSNTEIPAPIRNHKVITTVGALKAFLEDYKSAPVLACDIETTGLNWLKDKVIGVSFSKARDEAYYIPLTKGLGDLDPFWKDSTPLALEVIKTLLEGPSQKIFHNGSFDTKLLKQNLKIEVKNYCWDTFIIDHLLDENARGLHGLESCALRFTDFGSYKQPVVQWFKTKGVGEKDRNYSLLPLELIGPYGADDAMVTFILWEMFVQQLKEKGLLRLFRQIVMPVQIRLIETEFRGVDIDQDYLASLAPNYKKEMSEIEQVVHRLVGTFKITSPLELEKVLFTQLKLKPSHKTKTGRWSTDKDALEAIQNDHPVVKPIQRYKLISKLLSTYVVGLRKKLDPEGRLHTSYKVTGTTTGRLSSSNPNLQNIPAKVNDIQNAFVAGKDRVFIAADYSQAEFRAWAVFSQDPQMIADCNKGGDFDIHKEIASIVFHIPTTSVTKNQRNLAKTVLFGTMYGRGPKSVAEQFGVPIQEAIKILDYVKRRYPSGFRWITKQQHDVLSTGEVRTLFGRIRHLRPALESMNEDIKAQAMRLCVNSPVQGSIGDLNNLATLRVLSRFDKEGIDGHLALTIHDALIFSCATNQQDMATSIIREEMTKPVEGWNVPMFVDIKTGQRWGEVRKDEDLPEDFKMDESTEEVEEEEEYLE